MRVLTKYFDNLEAVLASRYSLVAAEHTGDKGEDREEFLVGILNQHLPAVACAYRGGAILDWRDVSSKQTDIVIYSSHAPRLGYNKKPLFLAEGAFAAIEVKSVLNMDALRTALVWSRQIKQLQKYPGSRPANKVRNGEAPAPICTGIFAYTSEIRSARAALKPIIDYHKSGVPNYEMLDFVCVNGKYCIFRFRTEEMQRFYSNGKDVTVERQEQCRYLFTEKHGFAEMLNNLLHYISWVGALQARLDLYLYPVSTLGGHIIS